MHLEVLLFRILRVVQLHRPQRCLHSHTCSPRKQEIFTICLSKLSLPAFHPSIWPVPGPSHFYKMHGAALTSLCLMMRVKILPYLDDWFICVRLSK